MREIAVKHGMHVYGDARTAGGPAIASMQSIVTVMKGALRLERGSVFLDIITEGESIGYESLFGLPQSCNVYALGNGVVRIISAEEVRAGLETDNTLYAHIVKQLLIERNLRQRRIALHMENHLGNRIITALFYFAERLTTNEIHGLSHEKIAAFVGTSREGVTHYMNILRRMGLLAFNRKAIVLQGSLAEFRFERGDKLRDRVQQEKESSALEAVVI